MISPLTHHSISKITNIFLSVDFNTMNWKMFIIFIVAIIATMSGTAVGKEVVEIGMVIETGCPFAKQVLLERIIPEVNFFAKEGKNCKLSIHGKVHYACTAVNQHFRMSVFRMASPLPILLQSPHYSSIA